MTLINFFRSHRMIKTHSTWQIWAMFWRSICDGHASYPASCRSTRWSATTAGLSSQRWRLWELDLIARARCVQDFDFSMRLSEHMTLNCKCVFVNPVLTWPLWSQTEIQLVQSVGVEPTRIIYANPCKQVSQIKYASAHGVQMMTFDSEVELMKVARCHDSAKWVTLNKF